MPGTDFTEEESGVGVMVPAHSICCALSIIITLATPQIIRREIPEVGTPDLLGSLPTLHTDSSRTCSPDLSRSRVCLPTRQLPLLYILESHTPARTSLHFLLSHLQTWPTDKGTPSPHPRWKFWDPLTSKDVTPDITFQTTCNEDRLLTRNAGR